MITGRVSADGSEAVIPLSLRDRYDRQVEIEAVIDTGFTGHLTLPLDVVDSLDLPMRGSGEVMLTDGTISTLPIYRVEVLWYARSRSVPAYAAPGGALLGMDMLRGSELRVEAVGGGNVTIKPLH